MTLTNSTTRVRYTGDGTTTTFAVPFVFRRKGDLSVLLYHADKTQTTATIASVTGAGSPNGGTVTLSSAPNAGVKVTVLRQVGLTQSLRLDVGGELPAKSLESALDHVVMQTQQLAEFQQRAIRLMPHTAQTSPILVEEPTDGTAPVYKRQSDGSYRLVPSSGSLESQLAESKGYVQTVQGYMQTAQTAQTAVAQDKQAVATIKSQADTLLTTARAEVAKVNVNTLAKTDLSNVSTVDFRTKYNALGITVPAGGISNPDRYCILGGREWYFTSGNYLGARNTWKTMRLDKFPSTNMPQGSDSVKGGWLAPAKTDIKGLSLNADNTTITLSAGTYLFSFSAGTVYMYGGFVGFRVHATNSNLPAYVDLGEVGGGRTSPYSNGSLSAQMFIVVAEGDTCTFSMSIKARAGSLMLDGGATKFNLIKVG